MEMPRTVPEYDNANQRVSLQRSFSEYRKMRREQRLGNASYNEVRTARRTYTKARRNMEYLYAQGGW